LDLEQEAGLQKAIIEIIQAGLAESVHDCSDGGLAVNLAESSFREDVGIKADISSNSLPAESVLFGEEATRIVISCIQENVQRIKQITVKYGISLETIGETVAGQVEVNLDGRNVISASVNELNEAYEGALEQALKTEAGLVAAD
jgi:phosphoribosylformylglycinamidine synthase